MASFQAVFHAGHFGVKRKNCHIRTGVEGSYQSGEILVNQWLKRGATLFVFPRCGRIAWDRCVCRHPEPVTCSSLLSALFSIHVQHSFSSSRQPSCPHHSRREVGESMSPFLRTRPRNWTFHLHFEPWVEWQGLTQLQGHF